MITRQHCMQPFRHLRRFTKRGAAALLTLVLKDTLKLLKRVQQRSMNTTRKQPLRMHIHLRCVRDYLFYFTLVNMAANWRFYCSTWSWDKNVTFHQSLASWLATRNSWVGRRNCKILYIYLKCSLTFSSNIVQGTTHRALWECTSRETCPTW